MGNGENRENLTDLGKMYLSEGKMGNIALRRGKNGKRQTEMLARYNLASSSSLYLSCEDLGKVVVPTPSGI
jgi:hypothetical protein